jgi:hypothetical protein
MTSPRVGYLNPGLDLETLLGLSHQGKREEVPLYPPWGGLFDLQEHLLEFSKLSDVGN